MKFKNALLIMVNLCYITVISTNHIDQDKDHVNIIKRKPNVNAKVKQFDNSSKHIKISPKKKIHSKPEKFLREDEVLISLDSVNSEKKNDLNETVGVIKLDSGNTDDNDEESSFDEVISDYKHGVGHIRPEHLKINNNYRPALKRPGQDMDKMTHGSSGCWMSLNTDSLFKAIGDINEWFANDRQAAEERIDMNYEDDYMLQFILSEEGAAYREKSKTQFMRHMIPSGLNLGGYYMMRMSDSILFFHRIKLRNDTHFRINFLRGSLLNMTLTARLSLNDLHLRGAFERSVTDRDSSVLYYTPTFGEMDILLKNVEYKMEGRYRVILQKLVIELLISEIRVNDILMTYVDNAGANDNPRIKLGKENIAEFGNRIKTDLDKWLKDFLNDYLISIKLTKEENASEIYELETYINQKSIALNKYMDNALDIIRDRIRKLKGSTIKIPKFTIVGVNGFQIQLHDGIFRGLDSIYRRSVTTSNLEKDIYKVDAIVGFSNLKVSYRYVVTIPTGLPPMSGVLTLSANELTARLSLSLVKQPEAVDIDIEILDQTQPESLTVLGSANILIAHFKHLLEHEIFTLMSNTLIHGIKTLKSLPKCEPFLPGQIWPDGVFSPGGKTYPNEHLKSIDNTNVAYSDTENEEDSPAIRTKKNKSKGNTRSKFVNMQSKLQKKTRKHQANNKNKLH